MQGWRRELQRFRWGGETGDRTVLQSIALISSHLLRVFNASVLIILSTLGSSTLAPHVHIGLVEFWLGFGLPLLLPDLSPGGPIKISDGGHLLLAKV